jgi:hypothetical protein
VRLNIDRPQVQGNELPTELNKWFPNIADQLDTNFGNIIATRTADIGGHGAGPISIAVPGMSADSIVLGVMQSSTNGVGIISTTATSTGFDILFNGDPGAHAFVNYIAFLQPWEVQGV